MSFDKTDVRDEMEMFMQAGIIKGHEPLNLYDLVDKYVSEHLDDRIQKVLNEF